MYLMTIENNKYNNSTVVKIDTNKTIETAIETVLLLSLI